MSREVILVSSFLNLLRSYAIVETKEMKKSGDQEVFYFLESSRIVTGPSLIRWTCMWLAN